MYGFKKGTKPEKEAKPLKGGKIEGPGTGTSDSIQAAVPRGSYIMPADSTEQIGEQALSKMGEAVPARVSNGEYQMPPEQVHAVGIQALNQMRDATHAPAAGFTPQASELYFADGGSPSEEGRRRQAMQGGPLGVSYGGMTGQPQPTANPQPQSQQPAAAGMQPVSYGDLQRAPSTPQPSTPAATGRIDPTATTRPSAPQPQPQPAAPSATPSQPAPVSFSGMQREPSIPRSGDVRQMPQGTPVTPSAVAQGFRAAGQNVTDQVAGAGRAAADAAAGAGRTAVDAIAIAGQDFAAGGRAATNQIANAGAGAGDALTYLNRGDPVRDAANAIGGFFSRSAQQARGTSYGGQTETAAPPATTPPPAAPSTPEGDPQAAPASTRPAPAATTPTQQPTQGPALGMRVSPTSAPEINRIDNAPGLNSPLFTNLPTGRAVSEMQGGTVSTLDMSGARAAAGRGGQGLGFQPDQAQQGPRASRIGGNDTQALIDQFNKAYDQRRAAMQRGLRPGEVLARDRDYASALSSFLSSQGKSAELELGAERADVQSQADQQRMDLDRQRVELDRQRVGADVTAKGFEARGMERVEKLYQQLDNAKTPEERAGVAEQIRAMNGKEAPNRFTVVPGGQEWDATAGAVLNRPAMVLNNQTGQPVNIQQQGAQGAATPLTNHIAALKKNPNQAAQFDAIYGEGAAARYLGAK